jgi:hypothetical protein
MSASPVSSVGGLAWSNSESDLFGVDFDNGLDLRVVHLARDADGAIPHGVDGIRHEWDRETVGYRWRIVKSVHRVRHEEDLRIELVVECLGCLRVDVVEVSVTLSQSLMV